MANDQLVLKVVQYIKEDYYDFAIKDLLKQEGISDDDIDLLLEKAKEIVFEEQILATSKKYKLLFALNIFLLVATAVYFLFVLPYQVEGVSVWYPLLGAVLICFLGYLSVAYYKSWELEFLRKHETININYSFLVILFLPGVVFYFIIATVFEKVAEGMLRENQIKVTGTVISGSENEIHYRRNTVKLAKIVVEFKTLEGEKIIATKDVSSGEFQDFYYQQEIQLIYSKTNPHNIGFLTSDSDLKKFKNSAEKDITPQDLVNLINIGDDKIKGELDKLAYGWEYSATNKAWINERKDIAMAFNKNSVCYIAPNGGMAHFLLENAGYVALNKKDANFLSKVYGTDLVYKKDDFIATIQLISTQNGEPPLSMTTIKKVVN